MGEASDNGSLLEFRRRCAVLCLFDEQREIFCITDDAVDVRASRITNRSGCVNTVFVAVLRRHDTVRRHQNRAVEGFKFFFLLPPGVTIISLKMFIFFERRIVVCRQHFGVGVNIDAGVHGLLEQHLEVAQIMTGDENTRAGADTEIDGGDLRIAVSGSIGLIEQCHSLHAVGAGLECECRQFLCGEGIVERCGESTLQEGIDFLVFF